MEGAGVLAVLCGGTEHHILSFEHPVPHTKTPAFDDDHVALLFRLVTDVCWRVVCAQVGVVWDRSSVCCWECAWEVLRCASQDG